MSQNVGTLYYTVEAETGKLLDSAASVDASLGQLNRQFAMTDKVAARTEFQMTKTAAAVRRVNTESTAATSVVSSLGKVLAGVLTIQGINSLVQMAEGYNEMAERVRMATDSQAEFELVQQRLLSTANGTYRALSEAQELYIRTADSLRSMGYSTQAVLDITDSMSYAFVVNASSSERADAAIQAYTKSINKGRVESDAWESIIAAIPSVIDGVAAATGRSAEEIRSLGASGKLSAQALNEGLLRSLDKNKTAADGMAVTVRDAFRSFSNSLSAYLGEANQASGATGILASAIKGLGDSIDLVVSGLVTLGAGALAAYIASLGKSAIASATTAIETRALAAEELRLAQAEVAATTAQVARLRVMSSMGAVSAELTVATAAQAAATARLAAAQASMVGIGSRLLGVLGGPVGLVAMLAAGAVGMMTFGNRADETRGKVDALTKSVGELGDKNLELARIQTKEAIANLQALGGDASKAGARIETLKKNLSEFPSSAKAKEWTRELANQEAALENANGKLDEHRQRLKDIDAEVSKRASGKSVSAPSAPVPAEATASNKVSKEISEQTRLAKENSDAIRHMRQEMALAALAGEELAVAQARASLNKVATPQDIAEVTRLASALWRLDEVERARDMLQRADPIEAERGRYQQQLIEYQKLNDMKLLSDQRYNELKLQAEIAHDEQMRVLQEENLRRQSQGYDILFGALNRLETTGADALTGLITGTTTVKELMQQLGQAILRDAVGALVSMGIQYVKNLIIGQAAQAAATTAGIAQAAALSAAFAPAAALASLATSGANAAGAQAGIASTMAITKGLAMAGGRQYGGPVDASKMYRINENGRPEVFQAANGQQYMLPNRRGEVVSNKEAAGQAKVVVPVTVHNYSSAVSVQRQNVTQTDGQQGVAILVQDLQSDGKVSQTLQRTFGLRRQGR